MLFFVAIRKGMDIVPITSGSKPTPKWIIWFKLENLTHALSSIL